MLKHELMPVPIAIAETNGSLRSGNKSLLLDVLLKNVDTNGVIDFLTIFPFSDGFELV
jgi:hypothetical protein